MLFISSYSQYQSAFICRCLPPQREIKIPVGYRFVTQGLSLPTLLLLSIMSLNNSYIKLLHIIMNSPSPQNQMYTSQGSSPYSSGLKSEFVKRAFQNRSQKLKKQKRSVVLLPNNLVQ